MKKLKTLIFALILVPCLLLFTACSNSANLKKDANVNTDNWSVTDVESINFTTYLAQDEVATNEINGLHFTVKANLSQLTNNTLSEIKFNAYLSFGEDLNQLKLISNITANNQVLSSLYILDDMVYVSSSVEQEEIKMCASLQTIKEVVEAYLDYDFVPMLDEESEDNFDFISMIESLDISSVKDLIKALNEEVLASMFANDFITVKAENDGEANARYEIKVLLNQATDDQEENAVCVYVAFNNYQIDGVKVLFNVFGIELETSVVTFNGSVNVPNLNNYTELSAEDLGQLIGSMM